MVGNPLTAAPPYESFAPFYDSFTAGSDYELWTSHVLDLAYRHGLTGTRLLDVACGTGKSFVPFLGRGFEATGADVSPAMLAEAARKTADAALVEADMRTLPVLGQFDLVVCFDDSLNHLLDEADLAAALRSMAANLAPAGLLMFDMNTLLAYRTTFAADRVFESEGDHVRLARRVPGRRARRLLRRREHRLLRARARRLLPPDDEPPRAAPLRAPPGDGAARASGARLPGCPRRPRRRISRPRGRRDHAAEGHVRRATRERR